MEAERLRQLRSFEKDPRATETRANGQYPHISAIQEYEPYPVCKKCGFAVMTMDLCTSRFRVPKDYVPGKTERQVNDLEELEYLKVRCARCSYQWWMHTQDYGKN